jgi:hypothetical protein
MGLWSGTKRDMEERRTAACTARGHEQLPWSSRNGVDGPRVLQHTVAEDWAADQDLSVWSHVAAYIKLTRQTISCCAAVCSLSVRVQAESGVQSERAYAIGCGRARQGENDHKAAGEAICEESAHGTCGWQGHAPLVDPSPPTYPPIPYLPGPPRPCHHVAG